MQEKTIQALIFSVVDAVGSNPKLGWKQSLLKACDDVECEYDTDKATLKEAIQRSKQRMKQKNAVSIDEWVRMDDACEKQSDGTIISYHCVDNGTDELEFIIERLRAVYNSGGAVQEIIIKKDCSIKS